MMWLLCVPTVNNPNVRFPNFNPKGSSGDELDSNQELSANMDVPLSLQVIPLNHKEMYSERIKVSGVVACESSQMCACE